MSLRKMLKVSLLMLLAMALAATTAHARLDLFGQLLTSKNYVPKPNSEVQVLVKGNGKLNVHDDYSGTIPYAECINTCDMCICTAKWPPEINVCFCLNNKSKKPATAVQEVESSSSRVKSEIMPYSECTETCKYVCACTPIWPPELSTCICSDHIESTAAKAIDEVEQLHKELDLLSKPLEKSGGGFMPYPECIKKCDECVVCTKVYPIEKAWCYCDKHTTSNSNKPAIQNSGDDKQVVLWTKAKLDSIPFEECGNTCKGVCVCTLPYPPEYAICVCMLPIKPDAAGKAIPTDQQVAKVKSEILPFEECQKTCKYVCACTLIWPPELSTCVCGASIKSLTTKTAGDDKKVVLWTKAKLDSIPYEECMQTCEKCFCPIPRPPEPPTCVCVIRKFAGKALPI